MNPIGLLVLNTPKGYKVYLWGQPDEHIMDWRGCNYRRLSIPADLLKQPRGGFPNVADAFLAFDRADESAIKKWSERAGDGTHLSDFSTFYRIQDRTK